MIKNLNSELSWVLYVIDGAQGVCGGCDPGGVWHIPNNFLSGCCHFSCTGNWPNRPLHSNLEITGTERQLGAKECPLQHLNKLGQLASEVHFLLRRTGPSLSDRQEKSSRIIHPGLLKTQDSEPPVNFLDSHYPPMMNGTSSSCKEVLFRQILQKHRMLKVLQLQLQDLEDEMEWWKQEKASAKIPGWNCATTNELDQLEQCFRNNEAELMQNHLWSERLQEETDREQELQSGLHQIHSSVDDYSQRIEELLVRSSPENRTSTLASSREN
ncbi:ras association domain-containing protein 8-like [Syngnathoides biaculeatus]|uniref:ras association domain-containing protein 8-like n=1 Tax=Syngnathoides biaculeatus TaxID=300417 RepID=UPI002ADD3921|nr:ras association domain-containing protein 8-like [Syngnathoides biaculeatus]